MRYLGELLAFSTAISWALCSIIFEAATKKADTVSINVLRLASGIIFLGVITFFTKGLFLPLDSSINNWTYLGISGVIGLFLGDIFLYQAFYLIGARLCMLFMTMTPIIVGIFGFFILGEKLTLLQLLAMCVTCSGILMVVIKPNTKIKNKKKLTPKGLVMITLGVTLEALGNIFTKKGAYNYDAGASTQIRMICALGVFIFYLTFSKKWGNIIKTVKDKKNFGLILLGTLVATLGITALIGAFNRINTGVASTIASISPIIVIPISIIVFKEKVSFREILGALISVSGIVIFFFDK